MQVVTFFHRGEARLALPEDERLRLERRFPGLRVVSVQDPAELRSVLTDAEVFVGWNFPREHFTAAPRLRWIHSAGAGVEGSLFAELVASDVILTNSTGLHAVAIPEHILAQMFVLARNLHEAMRLQQRAAWNPTGIIGFAAGVRELHGAKLAILGAGGIGRSLAPLAAGLGMRVRVMRRDATRGVPGAEAVLAPAEFHTLLAWADWVVCALPVTSETRGLIDAAALQAMRADAYLINVGRGESVVEDALIAALRNHRIAGAALDVFAQEPLPPDHPFWSLPNLVLTPHISGHTRGYLRKAIAIFEVNLERFLSGRPLRNVVDKRLGYARADEAR